MNAKKKKTKLRKPYDDRDIRARHRLYAYISTSIWDEKMNRRREFWLWERKRASRR